MVARGPLTVHNAEIHTASVEVKTLTISGKQVTLAVFRQLEETSLWVYGDADAENEPPGFAGTPWGRVNYHPDKCADAGAHVHVVWQEGDELRRAAVEPLRGNDWLEAVQTYAEARLASQGLYDHPVSEEEATWLIQAKHDLWKLAVGYGDGKRVTYDIYRPAPGTGKLRRVALPDRPGSTVLRLEGYDGPSVEEAEAAMWPVVQRDRAYEGRRAQLWEELLALPQLFIAV